jgi:hypothetical protein
MLDIERMRELMEQEPADDEREPLLDLSDGDAVPTDEDELTKAALIKQHHADHFGEPDPRSDEELWSAYREATGGT